MSQGRWQTTLERLNRFELRNAIEFIPLVRIEAWQLLLQRKPTIHELAHVAAKVEFLRDAAWKILLGQAPTVDLLEHFADRFEELRDLVWTELVRQNVPFDKLWWVQVPSDDSSQSRIWNHLVANHYDSLLTALKWLPLYDDKHHRFPIWRIAIKSNRLNALTTDVEARITFRLAGFLYRSLECRSQFVEFAFGIEWGNEVFHLASAGRGEIIIQDDSNQNCIAI